MARHAVCGPIFQDGRRRGGSGLEGCLIVLDLAQGQGLHLRSRLPCAIPGDEQLEGVTEVKLRRPLQVGVGAAGVQLQVTGLVGAGSIVEDPGGTVAPETGHLFGDPGDGANVRIRGAEVVGGRKARVVGEKFLGEQDVSVQRLEDVLPGTNRVRPTNADGLAGEEAAHQVGQQAIAGPVAATDDVAGSGSGEGDAVTIESVDGKVGLAEGSADDLGAGLAAGVGIVAAEWIGLAVGPDPLLVLVALVGGDGDDGAHAGGSANGVEHAGSADDVGLERADGIFVRVADQRLSGEVEDDLGCELLHGAIQRDGVADIAADVFDDRTDAGHGEEIGLRRGIECVAAHAGAELREPESQPASFEPGVAGEEDSAALPGEGAAGAGDSVGAIYHVFQGAFPVLHSSSSCWRSRRVSMACQKP
jgi:hypothetical protein